MIKTGLVSITFRQLSPQKIIEMVTRENLDSIEWGGDSHVPHGETETAHSVGKMTREAGLAVSAYGSYYRIGHSEQEGLSFENVLRSAVALKAPTIRVWAGRRESQSADEAYYELVASESRRIAEMAGEEGITVSYEYHAKTLTDTNESAQKLLAQVDHPNIRTLWQPPNNQTTEYCVEGLRGVLPFLTHLHVFHWIYPKGERVRRPLAEGSQRWKTFLKEAAKAEGNRFASIEFVHDGEPESFPADAAALREWCNSVAE